MISLVGGSFIAPLTLYMAKYVIVAEWAVKYVMLAYLAGALLSIPLWLRLSARVGKNRTWITALGVGTVGYALSYTYHEGTWALWICLAVVVGAANGCTMTLGPAISADVIDSDELETGQRREGAFIGVWSFVDKAAIGLAVFIGLQGLQAVGYVPKSVWPTFSLTSQASKDHDLPFLPPPRRVQWLKRSRGPWPWKRKFRYLHRTPKRRRRTVLI